MNKQDIKQTELFKTLADRELSEIEAFEIIDEMINAISEGCDMETILYDNQLELDYFIDLSNIATS